MPFKKQVIEVYLFVNPIGKACYEAEKEVMEFADAHSDKIHLHFIPLLNFQTLAQYMTAMKLSKKDLSLRNSVYSQIFEACLGYAAACMQGKKKGRQFLMALQEAVTEGNQDFSQNLLEEVARAIKLDIPMFLEDKASDLAKAAFESDQKIAREMDVATTPGCVIFTDQHKDHGLLIEDCVTAGLLKSLCQSESVSQVSEKILNNGRKDYLRVL